MQRSTRLPCYKQLGSRRRVSPARCSSPAMLTIDDLRGCGVVSPRVWRPRLQMVVYRDSYMSQIQPVPVIIPVPLQSRHRTQHRAFGFLAPPRALQAGHEQGPERSRSTRPDHRAMPAAPEPWQEQHQSKLSCSDGILGVSSSWTPPGLTVEIEDSIATVSPTVPSASFLLRRTWASPFGRATSQRFRVPGELSAPRRSSPPGFESSPQ